MALTTIVTGTAVARPQVGMETSNNSDGGSGQHRGRGRQFV